MHWDINDLNNKLSQINERIKNEKDEKKLLSLNFDVEILTNMINYISSSDVIKPDLKYRLNLISRSDINLTAGFLIKNRNNIYSFINNLSSISKLPAFLLLNKKIIEDEYFDLVDKFFKVFDNDHSTFYRNMISANRIEINIKEYGNKARGVAFHLNEYKTSYVASRHDGTFRTASTLPHEVGHACQFIDVSNIETDTKLVISLFREAYSKFIEYAFNDFLKDTEYRKYAFNNEWKMIDEFMVDIEQNNKSYCVLDNPITGSEDIMNTYRYFYSSLYALYFINMYREDKLKCMKEVDKFNNLTGKVSDEEIISLYSNESLLNSIREVRRNYIRTYRRR